MKQYLISTGVFMILILFSALIINTLYYFDLVNSNVYKILISITIILVTTMSSFLLGKSTKEKAYIKGIKFGLITISIMLILSIILKNISYHSTIYYPLILLSTIIGSSIGINTKKD